MILHTNTIHIGL